LDPYTIDFNSDFYRGKPLNADVIAGGIKADEARILGMGHDFEWLLINARGGAQAASAAARARLAARPVDVVVIGGRVRLDPAQTPVLEALVNAVIEATPGVRVRVQHFADRHGGSDYASVVITRMLLDLDASSSNTDAAVTSAAPSRATAFG
jgi:hypothetical protein